MAAACGPQNTALISPDLARLLREGPWNFEFFQAVRLLETMHAEREPVGRFSRPASEALKFRAHASTAFPASEIQGLKDSGEGQAEMLVNFMGLFGPQGVLPLYYTEMIAERARLRDTAVLDFLDIFNHRMISLFYRAWEKYRFGIAYAREDLDRVGERLRDFIGLGTPGLQDRQRVGDDALNFYSGLLSQQPRCASNLEGLLADYFEVPVEVEQFVGGDVFRTLRLLAGVADDAAGGEEGMDLSVEVDEGLGGGGESEEG